MKKLKINNITILLISTISNMHSNAIIDGFEYHYYLAFMQACALVIHNHASSCIVSRH